MTEIERCCDWLTDYLHSNEPNDSESVKLHAATYFTNKSPAALDRLLQRSAFRCGVKIVHVNTNGKHGTVWVLQESLYGSRQRYKKNRATGRRTKIDRYVKWLDQYLTDNGKTSADIIKNDAAQQFPNDRKTTMCQYLYRASAKLDVIVKYAPTPTYYQCTTWELPGVIAQ